MALADQPNAPGVLPRWSVICFIEDSGPRSRSALEHAARIACRRRGLGKSSRLIAVNCVRGVPFGLAEFCVDSGATVYLALASPPCEVRAMIQEVARQYRLAIETQEIAGTSEAAIVHVVRAGNGNVVILPELDRNAGRVARWFRRSLISRIAGRTQAIVTDEHGPSAVPARALCRPGGFH